MKKLLPLFSLIILFNYSAISQVKPDTIYLTSKKDTVYITHKKDSLKSKNFNTEIEKLRKSQLKKPIIIIGDFIELKTFEKGNVDIVKVSVTDNKYHITYFDSNKILKEYITPIKKDTIFKNTTINYLSLSVMAVPFKVRPEIGETKQYVKADLKTFGLYGGFYNRTSKHYLRDGTVNDYKFSCGLLIAPSAEEFNSKNTEGKITDATTNLVLSNGLTVAFTYRNVSFAIIPVGFDIGLTKDANNWIYNKKYWYGFGIGVDSKFFNF